MSGQAAPIGPWPRGLNTNNDIAAIADDELADVVNFDIDSSGTLISRPAIVFEADSPVDMTTVVLRNRAVNPSPQTSSAGWFAMDGTDLNDQHTSARTAVVGVSGYGWRATPVAAAAIEAENFEAGFGRPTGGDLRLTGTTELEYSIFAAVTPARSMRAAVTFYDAFGVIVGRLVGTPVALADDAALVRLAVVGTAPARALTASISAVGVAGGDDWDEDSWLTVDQVSTAPGDWFSGATDPPETAWLGPAYASISELRTEAEVLFATNFATKPDPATGNAMFSSDLTATVVSDGPYGAPGFRVTMTTEAQGPTFDIGAGDLIPVTGGETYFPKLVVQLFAPDARPMTLTMLQLDAIGDTVETTVLEVAIPPGEEQVIAIGETVMHADAVEVSFELASAPVGGGDPTLTFLEGDTPTEADGRRAVALGADGRLVMVYTRNDDPKLLGSAHSDDEGDTWTVGGGLLANATFSVTSAALAFGNGVYVAGGYVGTDDVPFLATSSDGDTWADIDMNLQSFPGISAVLSIDLLAFHAGNFYAVCSGTTLSVDSIWGLFTSTDGETWTYVSAVLTNEAVSPLGILVDSSSIKVTFSDAALGVLRSTDNGATWATHNPGQTPTLFFADDDGNLYAGQYTTWSTSTDDGVTWSALSMSPAGPNYMVPYQAGFLGGKFIGFGSFMGPNGYADADVMVWNGWTTTGGTVPPSYNADFNLVFRIGDYLVIAIADAFASPGTIVTWKATYPPVGEPWLEGDRITLGRVAMLDHDVAPFSGNTPAGGGYGYAWLGATNNSASTISVVAVGSSLDMDLLGIYTREDGRVFLVVATTNATWLYDITTKTWQVIWNNAASGFVQYDNKVVLISEDVPGGYWEDGSFTATPTMPVGSQIVFYQARLWAFGVAGTPNANTVWFSNIDSISVTEDSNTVIWDWTTNADFFMVNPGDGETITSLRVTPSALIIFRSSSTWQFTFPTSPLQGTLRVLSQTVGADTKWAVVDYENYWFTFSKGTLYQFINAQFYPVSRGRVNFTPGSLPLGIAPQKELRLSRFGERIVIWYRGATYVYSASYNSFTTWLSPTSRAAHFLTVIPSVARGTNYVAYAVTGENDPSKKVLWRMENDPLVLSGGEAITAIMRTKAFDFTNAVEYKRLFFWTAEIASAIGATAYLHPVALSFAGTTWDELETRTWDQLDEANWDALMVASSAIVDEVNFPLPAAVRLMLKLIRAVRFQRIYFELHLVTDGTQATAPAKVYGITPYIGVKAITSRKVS